MSTKNISITENAYKRLTALRNRENESFSEVIVRVTRKRNLMEFFGVLSKESADKIEKNIRLARKLSVKAEKEKINKIKERFA